MQKSCRFFSYRHLLYIGVHVVSDSIIKLYVKALVREGMERARVREQSQTQRKKGLGGYGKMESAEMGSGPSVLFHVS